MYISFYGCSVFDRCYCQVTQDGHISLSSVPSTIVVDVTMTEITEKKSDDTEVIVEDAGLHSEENAGENADNTSGNQDQAVQKPKTEGQTDAKAPDVKPKNVQIKQEPRPNKHDMQDRAPVAKKPKSQ